MIIYVFCVFCAFRVTIAGNDIASAMPPRGCLLTFIVWRSAHSVDEALRVRYGAARRVLWMVFFGLNGGGVDRFLLETARVEWDVW